VAALDDRNDIDEPIDLGAYLARIGYSGRLDPTVETLRGLHFAHATQIPFENLDILLGRGIALDLKSLQAKLVEGHRGGYCFEHNTLFAAVLESVGFAVTRLAARVRFGSQTIRPRSHMLLSVAVDGEQWLADVGFGGDGLLYPVRLNHEGEVRQGEWSYRVCVEGEVHVLQSLHAEGWFDLYAFTQEPQYAVDYVVSNHFTSTYPNSPFVRSLVAQRNSPEARWILRDRELTEERPDQKTMATIADDEALLATLADVFTLHFPAGTRFL
jgi:N-hydroxyarylamine O-acetyltransferase